MRARRAAHPTKVEAHRRPAALHKGARQRLHDLVVHGAAKQRVGMGDDGNATRRSAISRSGGVAHCLNGACRALQGETFSLGVHGIAILFIADSAINTSAESRKDQ